MKQTAKTTFDAAASSRSSSSDFGNAYKGGNRQTARKLMQEATKQHNAGNFSFG